MKQFGLLLFSLSCVFAGDLTDSWIRDIEFTPAEAAAMERGRQWEPLMLQGPDDPLGKKILAAGEPSFDALAAFYPGKILDRTVLGTYSDPLQPLGDYTNEFAIYWNGAIASDLSKDPKPAHRMFMLFHVGPDGEPFGRVRARYSSIGYEKGYLPIVTATYEVDGVRYRETALADRPKGETGGWDVAYVEFEMVNVSHARRTAVFRPEIIWNGGGRIRMQGGMAMEENGALLAAFSDTRQELPLEPGASAALALKIPYVPDTRHLLKVATLRDFAEAHQRVRDFWEGLIEKGAKIEVPEERVNNVWRALLLQNFVLADGPRLTYGSGLRYNDSTYPQECGFATHVFAMYGFPDYADALQRWFVPMSVTPQRKYQNRRAMVLHHLLETYRLTGKTDLFDRFHADYYRVADEIVAERHSTMKGDPSALSWGLLPPDKPGADVQASTQNAYVLGHDITNCEGLQDFGRFLVQTDIDRERGRKYLDEAADFRKTLLRAMQRATIRIPGRPPFLDLQTLDFARTPDYGPEPYDDLANGRLQGAYSHYWADMEFHYNFFNPSDEVGQWIADYLHARNGFTLGLTRSHKKGWVNTVYDGGYYEYRLRSGNVPEFLLGFYGRLAFAMSRYVYVASEGSPFIGYNTKDGGYVAADLDFPNSASNADTLMMLRDALVMEELKDNIETGDLDLLRGAPRAWLEPGKQIRIQDLPTYFGKISLRVDGQAGGVRADIQAPPKAARLLLYLRHPVTRVIVNGSECRNCDFEDGILRLAGVRRYTVEARY